MFVFISSVMAADQPRAVVEMFTSQGCSSCPPADEILSKYSKMDDVLALSFHVDYWNYLGWDDTFSQASFTDRQQRYAISFQRRGVYTPQAVVNGRDHAVGSRKNEIDHLIGSYQQSGKGLTVPIETIRDENNIRFTTSESTGNATMLIVYYDKQKQVAIKRGENRGKLITYHNVVRDVVMTGMMKDGKIDVTLPLDEMRRKGFDSCAVILQEMTKQGTPGAIVGAAVIADF